MILWRRTLLVTGELVASDDGNVAGYGVIHSHKHLNMLWVSGQGRDDNMTGPGDV